jgi:hypothetical protein
VSDDGCWINNLGFKLGHTAPNTACCKSRHRHTGLSSTPDCKVGNNEFPVFVALHSYPTTAAQHVNFLLNPNPIQTCPTCRSLNASRASSCLRALDTRLFLVTNSSGTNLFANGHNNTAWILLDGYLMFVPRPLTLDALKKVYTYLYTCGSIAHFA